MKMITSKTSIFPYFTHFLLNSSIFRCEICGKEFKNRRIMYQHRRWHNVPKAKEFKNWLFRNTKNKNIYCNVCGRKFGSKRKMLKHRYSHGFSNCKEK